MRPEESPSSEITPFSAYQARREFIKRALAFGGTAAALGTGLTLLSLDNSDVADLLHTARVRILAFLERRGVIERGPDPRLADDGFAEREPELAGASEK